MSWTGHSVVTRTWEPWAPKDGFGFFHFLGFRDAFFFGPILYVKHCILPVQKPWPAQHLGAEGRKGNCSLQIQFTVLTGRMAQCLLTEQAGRSDRAGPGSQEVLGVSPPPRPVCFIVLCPFPPRCGLGFLLEYSFYLVFTHDLYIPFTSYRSFLKLR